MHNETFLLTCYKCKAATPHRHVGHFVIQGGNSREAKLVYRCGRCRACRVWGSVELCSIPWQTRRMVLGPRVSSVPHWSLMAPAPPKYEPSTRVV
jgi:non-ribosomal peptide synthetase component E (peptide arylation enzyme)